MKKIKRRAWDELRVILEGFCSDIRDLHEEGEAGVGKISQAEQQVQRLRGRNELGRKPQKSWWLEHRGGAQVGE